MKGVSMRVVLLVIACGTTTISSTVALAQALLIERRLPLLVATAAAMEAISSCKANGYEVTATVVDTEGRVQVILHGDRATVHTDDNAFRKAYTIVTLGPIAHVDLTSELLPVISKYPSLAAQSLANTPNIVVLAGGAAIKIDQEFVGGIGVSGAPGGANDEACAKAGVAKVESLVTH